jgi:uncharacterized phiE125 gp8 family phage protein
MHYKVVTAVATEPVTSAEAKLHLRVDGTDDDTLIAVLITAAREAAEHYTGRALAPQTLEAALDCFPDSEGEAIELPMPPVASITHIKYTDTAGVEQTIDTGDYALSLYGDSRRVAPTYGNYWPSTQDIPDAVRVRYVTGYTTCPKAAKQAILLIVGHLYENRGDDARIQADDIQPPAAKALLNTVKVWGR